MLFIRLNLIFLFTILFLLSKGQVRINPIEGSVNNISTAVPFLTINTNSKSAGIGEIDAIDGIDNTITGITGNPAILAMDSGHGVYLNYTPWLSILQLNNIWLAETGAYFTVSPKSSIGFNFRYFNLGNISFTNMQGDIIGTITPNEQYASIRYSRKLGSEFSIGIGTKLFRSNLASNQIVNGIEINDAYGIAGDFGFLHEKSIIQSEKSDLILKSGLAFSNLGTKVTYTNSIEKDFIPSTMDLATGLISETHLNKSAFKLGIFYGVQKLLVPTPNPNRPNPRGLDLSVSEGWITSFADAPGGFREELNEIIHSLGMESKIELNDNLSFGMQSGIFLEHKTKGNRKLFNFGSSFEVYHFELSISYTRVFFENRSPLDHTIRLNLSYQWNS